MLFRVEVPYVETSHDAPGARTHRIEYEVEAEDWMTAIRLAIERFDADNSGEFHSWCCEALNDRVEVVELQSGKRFRLTDAGTHSAAPPVLDAPPDERAYPYRRLMAIADGRGATRDKMGAVLELAMEVAGAPAGSVLLLDEARGDLYFCEARGEKAAAVRSFRLHLGQGIAGWSAMHGETLVVLNASTDPQFHAEIASTIGYETRSIVCTPARIADRTVGVLELLNLPEGEKPSRDMVEFLEKCACLCGLFASVRH